MTVLRQLAHVEVRYNRVNEPVSEYSGQPLHDVVNVRVCRQ